MARTFNIATKDGSEPCEGVVALLQLGDSKHRFVMHDGNLSDYRSGYRVASLQAVKIERMARISSYTRTTDRQAAQITLDRIVARVGLDKVRAVLAEKPTLNVN